MGGPGVPDGQTPGARAGKDFQRSADETTMTIVIMTSIIIKTTIIIFIIVIIIRLVAMADQDWQKSLPARPLRLWGWQRFSSQLDMAKGIPALSFDFRPPLGPLC